MWGQQSQQFPALAVAEPRTRRAAIQLYRTDKRRADQQQQVTSRRQRQYSAT